LAPKREPPCRDKPSNNDEVVLVVVVVLLKILLELENKVDLLSALILSEKRDDTGPLEGPELTSNRLFPIEEEDEVMPSNIEEEPPFSSSFLLSNGDF